MFVSYYLSDFYRLFMSPIGFPLGFNTVFILLGVILPNSGTVITCGLPCIACGPLLVIGISPMMGRSWVIAKLLFPSVPPLVILRESYAASYSVNFLLAAHGGHMNIYIHVYMYAYTCTQVYMRVCYWEKFLIEYWDSQFRLCRSV